MYVCVNSFSFVVNLLEKCFFERSLNLPTVRDESRNDWMSFGSSGMIWVWFIGFQTNPQLVNWVRD